MPYCPIEKPPQSTGASRPAEPQPRDGLQRAHPLRLEPGARRRELRRPHHHPLAVLHLLHLREVVAVVVRPVEAEPPDDRRNLVLPEPLGEPPRWGESRTGAYLPVRGESRQRGSETAGDDATVRRAGTSASRR